MKEVRYFYVPDAANQVELPAEEATHALRVLRLKGGDEIFLMDGEGSFFRAEVTAASSKRCLYEIKEEMPQQRAWKGHIHLAIAPTKMMERIEWMAEKATEIGFDELSFLNCQFSERKVVKTPRIDKIVISAVKQSHKAWKPVVNELVSFKEFIQTPRPGRKFICHCYEEVEKKDFFTEISGILNEAHAPAATESPNADAVTVASESPNADVATVASESPTADAADITVLVGPEGDFSIDEVRLALENGYESVSLGTSRLRTETAGLVAVHMAHIARRL
jgi:16S rRNA (uracil1498-N3)-methyltransferase